MEDSVYVSNISKAIKEKNIQDVFNCIGNITNIEWINGDKENSCKIRFENPTSVKAAVLLSGTDLGDRLINVAPIPAEKTQKRLLTPAETIASLTEAARRLNPEDASLNENNDNEQQQIASTVYVGNVSPQITEPELREFFMTFGNVVYIKMAGNPTLGITYAFLEYDCPEAAQKAMAATSSGNAVLGDRPLKVGPAMNAIVKPPSVTVNSDPSRIESAMRRVMRAKRNLEARKGVKDEKRKDERSPRRSSRYSRSRSLSRSRYSKSSSSKSRNRRRNRSPRRRRDDRYEDENYDIYKPRTRPPPTRASRAFTQAQEGLVWDGFQWTQPSGLSVKQKSENLATKIMDVMGTDDQKRNPNAQQAMVQQAHQQAALLREHLNKLKR